jgi:hypothetical protein
VLACVVLLKQFLIIFFQDADLDLFVCLFVFLKISDNLFRI